MVMVEWETGCPSVIMSRKRQRKSRHGMVRLSCWSFEHGCVHGDGKPR